LLSGQRLKLDLGDLGPGLGGDHRDGQPGVALDLGGEGPELIGQDLKRRFDAVHWRP
jgi:hypothetical protein